jgi:hypothetical protein
LNGKGDVPAQGGTKKQELFNQMFFNPTDQLCWYKKAGVMLERESCAEDILESNVF